MIFYKDNIEDSETKKPIDYAIHTDTTTAFKYI